MPDQDDTKRAIAAGILAAFPDAATYEISSSDQGSQGWVLYNVALTDGTVIDDGEHFRRLDMAIDDDLHDLRWGVFGDSDADSALTIDVHTHTWLRARDR